MRARTSTRLGWICTGVLIAGATALTPAAVLVALAPIWSTAPAPRSTATATTRTGDSRATEAVPKPFQYPAGHLDDATGPYYLGARYYDPRIGRLSQPDPFGGQRACLRREQSADSVGVTTRDQGVWMSPIQVAT